MIVGTYLDADGLGHLSIIVKQAISTAIGNLELRMPKIYYATKTEWDSDISIVAEANTIYVYTDYKSSDGKDIAGIKVGDGTSYLIDMPFWDQIYDDHINDSTIHITQADRDAWNNKVRCYVGLIDTEELIFTTN